MNTSNNIVIKLSYQKQDFFVSRSGDRDGTSILAPLFCVIWSGVSFHLNSCICIVTQHHSLIYKHFIETWCIYEQVPIVDSKPEWHWPAVVFLPWAVMWAAVARQQTGNQAESMLSGKVSFDQKWVCTSILAPLHFPHMIRCELALQFLHTLIFLIWSEVSWHFNSCTL